MTVDELSALRSWVVAQIQYETANAIGASGELRSELRARANQNWTRLQKVGLGMNDDDDAPLARELVGELDREG